MLTPGQKFYHWTIISIDGRRATVQCKCHQVRIVAIEDLRSGVRTSCGCQPPSRKENRVIAEAYQQRQRRRMFDWKPENGR